MSGVSTTCPHCGSERPAVSVALRADQIRVGDELHLEGAGLRSATVLEIAPTLDANRESKLTFHLASGMSVTVFHAHVFDVTLGEDGGTVASREQSLAAVRAIKTPLGGPDFHSSLATALCSPDAPAACVSEPDDIHTALHGEWAGL